MDDKADRPEDTEAESSERTINDPLTRDDVEAPRAEFEGRRPEE